MLTQIFRTDNIVSDSVSDPANNPAEGQALPAEIRHELSIRPTASDGQIPVRREVAAPQSVAQEPAGTAHVVSPPVPSQTQPQRLLFTPTIDIYNTEEGLVLRADLPGVCVERLELQIEDNKLTLFGRVQENLPDGARLLHQEYQVGDFYRSFILSDEVAYDRISARMNAGVLEITLPRIPRAQPRKIHVQTD